VSHVIIAQRDGSGSARCIIKIVQDPSTHPFTTTHTPSGIHTLGLYMASVLVLINTTPQYRIERLHGQCHGTGYECWLIYGATCPISCMHQIIRQNVLTCWYVFATVNWHVSIAASAVDGIATSVLKSRWRLSNFTLLLEIVHFITTNKICCQHLWSMNLRMPLLLTLQFLTFLQIFQIRLGNVNNKLFGIVYYWKLLIKNHSQFNFSHQIIFIHHFWYQNCI